MTNHKELLEMLNKIPDAPDFSNTPDEELKAMVGKYQDDLIAGLFKLITLSRSVGMASHASIWMTLLGVFCDSIDEIDRVCTIIRIYRDTRIKETKHLIEALKTKLNQEPVH